LSLESEVLPALVKQGHKLRVFVSSDPFLDIGTPESLALSESFILGNISRFGIEPEGKRDKAPSQ
jgi:NDP-sugar pyrophosphorylase family protein